MPKLKAGTILPTPAEDAAIQAAALSDPDAVPFTDTEWEQVKPFLYPSACPGHKDKNIQLGIILVMRDQHTEKPLHWVGSSKKDLLALPADVVDDFGYALGAV